MPTSLIGLTVLVASVGFVAGVFVAFIFWGMDCMKVVEAESSTFLLKQQTESLESESVKLKKQLEQLKAGA